MPRCLGLHPLPWWRRLESSTVAFAIVHTRAHAHTRRHVPLIFISKVYDVTLRSSHWYESAHRKWSSTALSIGLLLLRLDAASSLEANTVRKDQQEERERMCVTRRVDTLTQRGSPRVCVERGVSFVLIVPRPQCNVDCISLAFHFVYSFDGGSSSSRSGRRSQSVVVLTSRLCLCLFCYRRCCSCRCSCVCYLV